MKTATNWYSVLVKILAIETSCDETGVCILQQHDPATVTILGNALSSQIDIHTHYGGVFPALAKRAHMEKIVPLLTEALSQAALLESEPSHTSEKENLFSFLHEKELPLKEQFVSFLDSYKKPPIDYIAVTAGPGLEPALWVGVNTAKILSIAWDIPIIPINHMEGHVVTAGFERKDEHNFQLLPLQFPILALLVSGGHTELVIAESFGVYKKIGKTKDDAVGEAFDKTARMLGLPYPGGPAISKLAAEFRSVLDLDIRLPSDASHEPIVLPRPMLHSGDYDFSFSGLKTAVLYTITDLKKTNSLILQNMGTISEIATAFEDAAIEVLVKKTIAAGKEFHTPTIIVGGGVAGNRYLRNQLTNAVGKELPGTIVLFPEPWLATDNAIMIGMAVITQLNAGTIKTSAPENLRADGNLSL